MKPTNPLLGVKPDGSTAEVPNTYDCIREGVGSWFDFVVVSATCGFYIRDEGLFDGSVLNTPASIFAGRPIYGEVVLTAAQPDDEGDTQPPSERDAALLLHLARCWASVVANADGQDLTIRPDGDKVPPFQIIQFETQEEFLKHLTGEV